MCCCARLTTVSCPSGYFYCTLAMLVSLCLDSILGDFLLVHVMASPATAAFGVAVLLPACERHAALVAEKVSDSRWHSHSGLIRPGTLPASPSS